MFLKNWLMNIKSKVTQTRKAMAGYGSVIDMALALLIFAGLGVSAITSIETANTTGWSANTLLMWGFTGVLIVIGFIKKFVLD